MFQALVITQVAALVLQQVQTSMFNQHAVVMAAVVLMVQMEQQILVVAAVDLVLVPLAAMVVQV
jgi:hypothetical protein